MQIEDTLAERKKTHGPFDANANASQDLKETIILHATSGMSRVQLEVLDVICSKIARIIVGNPNEIDHWHDIAGYATLAKNDIKGDK